MVKFTLKGISNLTESPAYFQQVNGIYRKDGALAVIGGVLLSYFSWRSIYLAPLLVVVLGFLLVALFSVESKNTEESPKLDIFGAVLLMLCIGSFVLAIVQGGFWRASTVTLIYLFSLICLVFLLLYERGVKQPIIREDLFKNRRFILSSIANGCLIFFVWASFFSLPFYMQSVAKLSPTVTGLILVLVNVPLILLSQFVGRYCEKYDPKKMIALGFVFLLVSLIVQYSFSASSPIFWFALAALAFGLGWVAIWGPTTTGAVSTLSSAKAGIASGTFITVQEIGGTLGLAVVGSVIRVSHSFSLGFHQGVEVLFGVTLLGLVVALLLRSKQESDSKLSNH